MTRQSSTLRILALLLLCVTFVVGCATPRAKTVTPPDAVAPLGKPLRVGVARSAPPLIFGEGENVEGIEADLARKMGEALNRPVEFVPMFFPDLITELRAQRIQIIMAGMSVTPGRERVVRFAEPYLINGLQGLIREDEAAKLGSVDRIEMGQWRIGVEKDSTAAVYVERRMSNATVVVYPTIADAVKSLTAPRSRIDLVLYDSTSVRWFAARSRDEGAVGPRLIAVPGLLTEEPIAWAVHPSDDELLKQANDVLAKWKADGTLDAILAKWLPTE